MQGGLLLLLPHPSSPHVTLMPSLPQVLARKTVWKTDALRLTIVVLSVLALTFVGLAVGLWIAHHEQPSCWTGNVDATTADVAAVYAYTKYGTSFVLICVAGAVAALMCFAACRDLRDLASPLRMRAQSEAVLLPTSVPPKSPAKRQVKDTARDLGTDDSVMQAGAATCLCGCFGFFYVLGFCNTLYGRMGACFGCGINQAVALLIGVDAGCGGKAQRPGRAGLLSGEPAPNSVGGTNGSSMPQHAAAFCSMPQCQILGAVGGGFEACRSMPQRAKIFTWWTFFS